MDEFVNTFLQTQSPTSENFEENLANIDQNMKILRLFNLLTQNLNIFQEYLDLRDFLFKLKILQETFNYSKNNEFMLVELLDILKKFNKQVEEFIARIIPNHEI